MLEGTEQELGEWRGCRGKAESRGRRMSGKEVRPEGVERGEAGRGRDTQRMCFHEGLRTDISQTLNTVALALQRRHVCHKVRGKPTNITTPLHVAKSTYHQGKLVHISQGCTPGLLEEQPGGRYAVLGSTPGWVRSM
jgi:hypothetical protein